MFHDKSKHIETSYHCIRDLIEKKELYMEHCSTKGIIVDIFKKTLLKPKIESFRSRHLLEGLDLCRSHL